MPQFPNGDFLKDVFFYFLEFHGDPPFSPLSDDLQHGPEAGGGIGERVDTVPLLRLHGGKVRENYGGFAKIFAKALESFNDLP